MQLVEICNRPTPYNLSYWKQPTFLTYECILDCGKADYKVCVWEHPFTSGDSLTNPSNVPLLPANPLSNNLEHIQPLIPLPETD